MVKRKHAEKHMAKIFKNGSSQAIRLPKEYRLEGKVVAIFHLGKSVVLQPVNESWRDIYHAMVGLSEEDFAIINNSALEDLPPQEREVL